MSDWLPGAKVVDLHPAIGNGPFSDCYGVILHVNVDHAGTPDSFWGNGNPGQVCPNFQVYKDGSIHQMLPIGWQPWCQMDGNFHYAAIETAGYPDEPLTDAQIASCAKILRAYHDTFGVPLRAANAPGERGLGTHAMGGASWGGHPCPGDIRSKQRAQIIASASGNAPHSTGDFTMDDAAKKAFADLTALVTALSGDVRDLDNKFDWFRTGHDGKTHSAEALAGSAARNITFAQFDADRAKLPDHAEPLPPAVKPKPTK